MIFYQFKMDIDPPKGGFHGAGDGRNQESRSYHYELPVNGSMAPLPPISKEHLQQLQSDYQLIFRTFSSEPTLIKMPSYLPQAERLPDIQEYSPIVPLDDYHSMPSIASIQHSVPPPPPPCELYPITDNRRCEALRTLLGQCDYFRSSHYQSSSHNIDIQRLSLTGRYNQAVDFPGMLPVPLSRSQFNQITNGNYMVAEQTDGVRFLMIISAAIHGVILVDKAYTFWRVEDCEFLTQFADGTIFDGEFCLHHEKMESYYLIYDCLKYCGTIVTEKKFRERLEYVGKFIGLYRQQKRIGPFNILGKTFHPKEKFNILKAGMIVDDKDNRRLLKDGDGSKRFHMMDGLLFVPSDTPYIFGRCTKFFKWKFLDMIHVNFAIQFKNSVSVLHHRNFPEVRPEYRLLNLSVRMDDNHRCTTIEMVLDDFCRLLDDLFQSEIFPNEVAAKKVIAEFAFDPLTATWRYHRLRTEQNKASDVIDLFSAMESIAERIDIQEIFNLFEQQKPPGGNPHFSSTSGAPTSAPSSSSSSFNPSHTR